MMTNAGTAMTTTATILRFNEVLRLFKAFFFGLVATNSVSHVDFLLPPAYGERGLEIDCMAPSTFGVNRVADGVSRRNTSKVVFCQGRVSMVADFALGQRGFSMPVFPPVFPGIEKARMRSVPCNFPVKIPPLVLQGCRC